ncbi:MAG: DUF2085 domain-containing protein [Ktedonobacteraceae bacterium]|jgi:uncharacterized membrane protein
MLREDLQQEETRKETSDGPMTPPGINITRQATHSWVIVGLGSAYLLILAVLVFFPGPPLLDRLRWLDSGICAQLPTHSFYPGNERLPLCARNTGIYLGFIITLLTLCATGHGRAQRLPPWPIMIFLLAAILTMAIDGFNSFLLDLGLAHLYQPHNLLRLATGLITGLALAILALPPLNYLFWREYNEKRSVSSWFALLLFMPELILCFFAVASQNALVLYPIALLSTIGLLVVISSVNLIVILALSKREQIYEHYRQLVPFFGLALLLGIGEMLILAQLKYSLLQVLGM